MYPTFPSPALNPNALAGDGQGLVQLAALADSLEYVAASIARSGEERAEATVACLYFSSIPFGIGSKPTMEHVLNVIARFNGFVEVTNSHVHRPMT